MDNLTSNPYFVASATVATAAIATAALSNRRRTTAKTKTAALSNLTKTNKTMGRKILLCFDGSGENPELNGPNFSSEDTANKTELSNSERLKAYDGKSKILTDNGFSNVVKLHLLAGGALDPENTKENVKNQISLYIEGVGGQSDNALIRTFNNYMGGCLATQTRPIRQRLEEIYEEGDEIFITGFSRGASSARTFAVELQEKGLTTIFGNLVKPVPVELLCCFDTVSDQFIKQAWNPLARFRFYNRLLNLGIQSSDVLGEKDGQLPDNVKKAVHNISLDDVRAGMFSPVFMDSSDTKRVHEVWFPGVHSDVGGAYFMDGVSDISGRYMQKYMEEAGLKFLKPEDISEESLKTEDYKQDFDFETRDAAFKPDASAMTHLSVMLGLRRSRPIITVKENDHWEEGVVRIHESFLARIQSDSPMQHLSGTEPEPYYINKNLKDLENFVVVGDMNEKLPGKTEELKKALEAYKYYVA